MYLIKQFGLQRSGTNIIQALLEINFKDVFILSKYLGDKHEPTDWSMIDYLMMTQDPSDCGVSKKQALLLSSLIEKRKLPIIINVKDLVSWIAAYYRYAKKKILFKNPQAIFKFDRKFCTKQVAVWKEKMLSWATFSNGNPNDCIIINHYDLLIDPIEILSKIEGKFDLHRKHKKLINSSAYAKRGTYIEHGFDLLHKNKSFNKDYHLKNQWIDEVPEEIYHFLIDKAHQIKLDHPILEKYIILDFTPVALV